VTEEKAALQAPADPHMPPILSHEKELQREKVGGGKNSVEATEMNHHSSPTSAQGY
jgi:hypothetical protein